MKPAAEMASEVSGLSATQSAPKETVAVGSHEEREIDEGVSARDEEGAEEEEEEEEEFVLLDLDEVFHGAGLPPKCPYTLSGLDTMNPILTLGGSGLRLIGEYEETVGTCLVFTETVDNVQQGDASGHPQPGNAAQTSSEVKRKRVNSLCTLNKRLKFRLLDAPEKSAEESHK